MSLEFDLSPFSELPRHRAFLQILLPGLAALKQTQAIWLTGSLARGDADHWSSVDLCLLWSDEDPIAVGETIGHASPNNALRATIEYALGEGNALFDQHRESTGRCSQSGITLVPLAQGGLTGDHSSAGILFEIQWITQADARELTKRIGPVHLMYTTELLPDDLQRNPPARREALSPPDTKEVDAQLCRFWLLLARLPAAVKRQEKLAAHALLSEMRILLIDLVVSLNGANRPQTRARINQYLGKAQREAFERSMGIHQPSQRRGGEDSADWIGQAVALVVLYRWYAPQLVEKYALAYPQPAEDAVLSLLVAEMENWPAHIATG